MASGHPSRGQKKQLKDVIRYGVTGLARDAVSSPSGGEVLSFDASSFTPGSLSTFEKSIQVINHLHLLRQQIDGPLYYHPKLRAQRIQGTVHVRVVVNPDGSLRRVEEDSWRGDKVLKRWVRRVLGVALKEPFLHSPMKMGLELDLNFYFQIQPEASLFTYGPKEELNTFHFYVYEVMPSKYDITTGEILKTVYEAMTENPHETERKLETF